MPIIKKRSRRPDFARYLLAVVGVVVATALRSSLTPLVGTRIPFALYSLVVILSSWHLGLGPSLLVIVLSTVSAMIFFIPPFRELGVATVTDVIAIALFVFVNVVVVWYAEIGRIARRRLELEVAERVRAEATILEQIHLVEFGREIGLALTSSPSLIAVLDRCVRLTIEYLGGDRARIDTLDDAAQFVPTASRGVAHAPVEDAEKTDESALLLRGLIGRVATERRPLLTNHLIDDSGMFERSWVVRENIVALAAFPLVIEDRLVGIWSLFSRTPLADSTLKAMESVASALAVGIERKRTEEILRVGEARKTAILETSLDGIITMDHLGNVVEFNRAAEGIFGYSAASVQGRPMSEVLIPKSLQSSHHQGLARYLATGEGAILDRRIEVTAMRSGGVEFPAELTVARIPIDGPPMFTAHIRDISDRKRAEEALRSAKEEAEDANRTKDRFIAVLSHELRTPLNPISLTVNSLLGKAEQDVEVRRDLELINHYVSLEARLIDDLLDVMRIARGKMPLRSEATDAHELVEQAASSCSDEIAAKSLQLVIELRADHSKINADPNRLRQVFWNLIKNAVKFTPIGGSITIGSRNEPIVRQNEAILSRNEATLRRNEPTTPRNEVITRQNEPTFQQNEATSRQNEANLEKYLIIEISDTGIGIEPEVLPRVFEAFQQGEFSINRQFGGLGLGLAICNGVVEGHGGTLSARSRGKGQGTTFTVRLRALVASTEEARQVISEVPTSLLIQSTRPVTAWISNASGTSDVSERMVEASLEVLIVEDEPATIRLMARLLRSLGHQVTAAETIAEASRWVEGSKRFDLIVSDIGLPDGTGLDLMRRVQATRGKLPGIALTGYGTEEDIEQSRLAGFSAHMTKPIDFNQLQSLIRQVVGATSVGY